VLHKEIPFLRICLPLCGGIISGLYIYPDRFFLITAILVIISGYTASLLYNKLEVNKLFGYTLTSALFLCGLLLYTQEKSCISKLDQEQYQFSCTISDYPIQKANSYMLTVRLTSRITDHGNEPVKGSLLLYHRKDSLVTTYLPGDLIIIKCTSLEILKRGNPYEFDYSFYMENQGVKYYAFTGRQNIVSHTLPYHRKMIHKALIIREKIIKMYQERGITGERLALVAAITLGQKNMLDPEQKSYFIKAGVMHIMAVSGLHTVILSLFVFNVLFFLKGRLNIIRVLLTILILWSFAFVTGLTPSVMRATLMFSFLQAGNLMKRPVNGINSVLASAFVLILIKPSVIFDAGFLLSYSAVIYIIAFYRELYLKLQLNNFLIDKVWQSAVVTIVAQAGTLPLTIMLFNRFPTYFILTNIIIVPLSSVLVITGCLVPLFYHVRWLSGFIAMLLSYLTGLTELLTRKASSLPLATIENIGLTTIESILLTGTIFLFTYFLLKRKSIPVLYPLSALTVFLLAGTAREIHTRVTNELIIYNTPGSSTIGIRTGKILNLFSDTTVAGTEVKRHCAVLGLKIKTGKIGDMCNCITAGKTKILITNSSDKNIPDSFSPAIVILTGSGPEASDWLNSGISPETIVIATKGNPDIRILKLKKTLPSFPVFFVKKSGTYIRRI
jgi:competence protein ComEC